jgi:3'(2'), 5'-bisphosphate nucleotidase
VQEQAKADASPVTVADFASQAVVLHLLQRRLGVLPVLAEESSAMLRASGGEALLARVVEAAAHAVPGLTGTQVLEALDPGVLAEPGMPAFVLDPVDGTKGFLRGGQYAVALGWIEDGAPKFGVLGCPNMDVGPGAYARPGAAGTVYWSVPGGGVHEVDLAAPSTGRALPPRVERQGVPRVAQSLEAGHTRHEHVAAIFRHLGVTPAELRLDGQGKYALLARDEADIYLRVPSDPARRECAWDHAAGVAVATGAGLVATDLCGAPLDFAAGPTLARNLGILVAPPRLHGELLAAIADVGALEP